MGGRGAKSASSRTGKRKVATQKSRANASKTQQTPSVTKESSFKFLNDKVASLPTIKINGRKSSLATEIRDYVYKQTAEFGKQQRKILNAVNLTERVSSSKNSRKGVSFYTDGMSKLEIRSFANAILNGNQYASASNGGLGVYIYPTKGKKVSRKGSIHDFSLRG
jgi:hypothetical protein